ncbi:hypothetical protein [Mesorhizobium sp.]|uniref:hypothetical protein n=1 Tax=Mesorhizobium sp. TaxID=1871066 RepID=UPI0025F539A7|nr:hypothetical protein [Mesorhizobium sp.]
MSQKTVFSSARLPSHLSERDRFSLWQDIHVAEIWSVEYGISENLPFEATIEASAIGPVVLGQMSGTIKHATTRPTPYWPEPRSAVTMMSAREKRPWSQRQSL